VAGSGNDHFITLPQLICFTAWNAYNHLVTLNCNVTLSDAYQLIKSQKTGVSKQTGSGQMKIRQGMAPSSILQHHDRAFLTVGLARSL